MWKEILGNEVYVEDGFVLRGVSNGVAVYPYRKSRSGGWDLEKRLTESAFRSGVRRGTIRMM